MMTDERLCQERKKDDWLIRFSCDDGSFTHAILHHDDLQQNRVVWGAGYRPFVSSE